MKKITKTEHNLINDSNSGAKISIVNRDDFSLIKKAEKINLDRFKLNIVKQEIFLPIGPFKSASILSKRSIKNKVEILMPFYNGLSGSSFSKKINLQDLDFLLDSFLIYFKFLYKESAEKKLSGNLLIKKCDSIKNGINKNKFFSRQDKSFLLLGVDNLKKSIKTDYVYPHSSCHGDFTLNNMIYDDVSKSIVLIDFLDTYISSYLIDIAKIKQDLVYGWSVRREPKTVRIKAYIMGEHIYKNTHSLINKKYKNLFKVIDCLNTLRIAPYINDNYSKEWILEVLKNNQSKELNL